MVKGFRMGGCGGGAPAPAINPTVIDGTTINYPCDSTLSAGSSYMQFTYPDSPFIYDLDLTDVRSLIITALNTVSDGALVYTISGDTYHLLNFNTSGQKTFTIDVSTWTGVHTLKLSNNAVGTIRIYSMILEMNPKFPIIYSGGGWGVAYDNPGSWVGANTGATLNQTSVSVASTSSSSALIATSQSLDLSRYNTLHIQAYNTGSATPTIMVTNSKDVSDYVARNIMPTNSGYTEYTVDVTNISSGYIAVYSASGYARTCQFNKIWLS